MRIYIVPLSIIRMHNLKGKYVIRLFVLWSDTLITAPFLLSKVLFCIFFMKPLFFAFGPILLIACTVLCSKGLMRIHSKGRKRLLCRSLSIEQKASKGKFTHNWNCLPKAGVLFSNPTQPFWSLVEWRKLPILEARSGLVFKM